MWHVTGQPRILEARCPLHWEILGKWLISWLCVAREILEMCQTFSQDCPGRRRRWWLHADVDGDPKIVDARECVIATLTRLAPINIAVIVAAPATNPNVLGQLHARQTVIYAVRAASARLGLSATSCLPELRQGSTSEMYIYICSMASASVQ